MQPTIARTPALAARNKETKREEKPRSKEALLSSVNNSSDESHLLLLLKLKLSLLFCFLFEVFVSTHVVPVQNGTAPIWRIGILRTLQFSNDDASLNHVAKPLCL